MQLYSSNDVANACLELQNDHGLDVNMLLLCVWFGQNFGLLSDTSLQQAIAFSNHWRGHVVQPLRDTRQWMKSHSPQIESQQSSFSEVREQVKKVELKAEKHQQSALEEIVISGVIGKGKIEGKAKGLVAIQTNLQTLLSELAITDSVELNKALSVVTGAASKS